MRASEILLEQIRSISNSNPGGSLEGYVVDTALPQLTNYLSGQGVSSGLINSLKNKYSRVGIIRNMYIDPDQRGQGHGGELLGNAINSAFDDAADAIILVADLDEENAIDLVQWYENYDFVKLGKAHNNILMVLEK